MQQIEIYTDGACVPNPGQGGWAAILLYKDARKEIFGSVPDTTNNRMELLAVIKALEALKNPCAVKLYTDSNYVRQGISSWILKWSKNGWKTASKNPVMNKDLWVELDALSKKHQVEWIWVKAHNGNLYNEEVDSLANNAARGNK